MAEFLLKLIPPRPTFAQDMNAVELNLMQQHSAYWQQLLDKNIALVFGPVLDPKWTWGMAIIQVAGEEEALLIAQNDPTVKASLNAYEIFPMKVFTKNKQDA